MSIKSVMPCNHLILCRPLLLLPSVFPSIRVFPSELALHIRWPSASASALFKSIPMLRTTIAPKTAAQRERLLDALTQLADTTFQMSQFFASHGQSIGLSASTSLHISRGSWVLSPNISFNLKLSLGRMTISPLWAVSVRTISPLDGIRISVIFSFSLPARVERMDGVCAFYTFHTLWA